MKATNIEWCDFSANPLKYRDKSGNVVWACVKVSPGCQNCYSEALAKRYGRGGPFTPAIMRELTPFVDYVELKKIVTAKMVDKIPADGGKVFVGDMTDVFGDWVPFDLIDELFVTFALRKDMIFQVLTKRPDRMAEYFAADRQMILTRRIGNMIADAFERKTGKGMMISAERGAVITRWPLPNVWLGTSVENQATADERIPHLLKVPASVRFLSCEPLLGPVDIGPWLSSDYDRYCRDDRFGIPADANRAKVDWVIVGGESGPVARPCKVEWIRSIVSQCKAASVPCFVKQLGSNPEGDERPPTVVDPVTKMRTLHVMEILTIKDRKGGDMAEWPADLRVREFPKVGAA